jgi:hypothetical protein
MFGEVRVNIDSTVFVFFAHKSKTCPSGIEIWKGEPTATIRRTAADHYNSADFTSPKTSQRKSKSARNGLKHGFVSYFSGIRT